MKMPDQTSFAAATYICEDCKLEHNGDAKALPVGWDKVTDPISYQTTVRCPDCLEAMERDWIEAKALLGYGAAGQRLAGAIAEMGVAAARFTGTLQGARP